MKLTSMLAAGALSVAALCLTVAHAESVPSVLSTEALLTDPQRAGVIDEFWVKHGQAGRFSGQGGLDLAFMSFKQQDAASEKGAIVISSGRTESLLKYREVIYDLWTNGYSVYIHDHRGQGLSARESAVAAEPQKGHVGRFDDYVDDLRSFVDRQVLPNHHRNLYLMAHSMGGAVAALLLESEGAGAPPRFRAAVLASPMLKIKGIAGVDADLVSCRIASAEMRRSRASSYVFKGGGYRPKSFEQNQYTRSPIRYERLVAVYQAHPEIQLGSPTWGWFANACDAAYRARMNAARISTPLLVMQAGADQIVHPAGMEEFCKRLRGNAAAGGCDGQRGGPIVMADAEHEMLIERDAIRGAFLDRTLAFFESKRGLD